jgi:hypothetical protein
MGRRDGDARRNERSTRRYEARGTNRRSGLALEGPGFYVWDEVPSEARRLAAELTSAAPFRVRFGRG